MTNQPASLKLSEKLKESEFIEDLLNRQDSVLQRLDELNQRIESAILEIGKARQLASDTDTDTDTETEPEAASQPAPFDAQPPISKAA